MLGCEADLYRACRRISNYYNLLLISSYCVKTYNVMLYHVAAFTAAGFEQFVQAAVPLTIWMGIISLVVEICRSLLRFEISCTVFASIIYNEHITVSRGTSP